VYTGAPGRNESFIADSPNAYYPYNSYIYPHPLAVAPFGTNICDEGAITSSCWCQGIRTTGTCLHGYYQIDECQGKHFVKYNNGTIKACSCNQTDVQAAINNANRGDVVQVPAGFCTWTPQLQGCTWSVGERATMLCMTKGIRLQGGVGGVTAINLSGITQLQAIAYVPDADAIANDEPFEFTGFTIDANNIVYQNGVLGVSSYGNKAITKIMIHNNTFKNELSETIQLGGPVYGVAYANTFIDCQTVIREEGGDDWSWNLNQREYGTGNNFYFEDNNATATTAKSTGAFSAGQGGSIVIRYNTYDLGQLWLDGNQWQDLHGLQSMAVASGFTCPSGCGYDSCLPTVVGSCNETKRSCEQWSQIKTEWYGNIHTNFLNPYGSAQEWMRLRGSWMLMFNNVITGTGVMPLPAIYEYSCDSCQSGTGPRYSMHVQNTYVWNNMGNGINRPIYVEEDNCGSNSVGKPYTITENVDYWNYNANTLNGNSQKGINCGSSPPTSKCSIGDGYWQTSFSPCSTPPVNMVDMKTYTEAGKFYKCTAPNIWTEYYKPYIYPHPLTLAPFGTDICGEGQIGSDCWCQGMKSDGYCCHGYYQSGRCEGGGAQPIPGDLNSDGVVNFADLMIVVANFDRAFEYDSRADINGNGVVDIFDIIFVASRFT
jgi:hypothetical protein